jgi:hypothetical protein
MEHTNIFRITEKDFDDMIQRIGGRRLSKDDSREKAENADYILDNALIELKIVEEEPSSKQAKQDKLALLFGNATETVVIDPRVLDETGRRQYYKIIGTPIKQHVKKAASQLKRSRETLGCDGPRIAILVNNGLYCMSRKEFESAATKYATHDTEAIDILLVGGIYYYSDTFDMYAFPRLSTYYMNGHFGCQAAEAMRTTWDWFVEKYMRSVIIDTTMARTKEPVRDICFERSGVRYVKLAPRLPASSFWPGGVRPREDSTGQDICPPVARVIPMFSREAYDAAMQSIVDKDQLRGTLFEYNNWCKSERLSSHNLFCPILGFELCISDCACHWYYELCNRAAQRFDKYARELLDRALPWSERHVALRYVLLVSREIGIDKASDIVWISMISEVPGFEKELDIISGRRMKFEHALALASAYAILHECPQIYYVKDRRYALDSADVETPTVRRTQLSGDETASGTSSA